MYNQDDYEHIMHLIAQGKVDYRKYGFTDRGDFVSYIREAWTKDSNRVSQILKDIEITENGIYFQ